jgi:hypothetical protein
MAMSKLPWKPWHEVVQLLDELRTGELSLSMFAADLYDVIMGRARPLYQNREKFFKERRCGAEPQSDRSDRVEWR